MTTVELADAGDWTEAAKGMGPGSHAGTMEEEDFRTESEHPDSWIGPAEKVKSRGWGLVRELDPQTTDRLDTGLLQALTWTE